MERAFETVLVEQCAPVLAGIKAANLFRLEARDRAALYAKAAQWHHALQPRGLQVRVLRECPENAGFLIYVFRAEKLWQKLCAAPVQAYLHGQGYTPAPDCEGYLRQLSCRLCSGAEFPHEIGVFLGYPLEDVIGFVENRGKNFTCCGCWKSYGDPAAAQAVFDHYRKCTEVYLRCFRSGTPITRLAVAG